MPSFALRDCKSLTLEQSLKHRPTRGRRCAGRDGVGTVPYSVYRPSGIESGIPKHNAKTAAQKAPPYLLTYTNQGTYFVLCSSASI